VLSHVQQYVNQVMKKVVLVKSKQQLQLSTPMNKRGPGERLGQTVF